jgi:hypothetical protein
MTVGDLGLKGKSAGLAIGYLLDHPMQGIRIVDELKKQPVGLNREHMKQHSPFAVGVMQADFLMV